MGRVSGFQRKLVAFVGESGAVGSLALGWELGGSESRWRTSQCNRQDGTHEAETRAGFCGVPTGHGGSVTGTRRTVVSFPAVTPLTDFQFLPSLFESEARSSHSDSKSEGLEVCSNVWYISLERGGVRVERLVFGPNMEDLRALRDQ